MTFFKRNLLMLLIAISCIIPYLNSLFNSFVWDDITLITDNPYIRSFRFLPEFFTKDIWYLSSQKIESGYYRPLLAFSFMLDYLIYKRQPFGYHLTNLALHILVCILLFFFVGGLFKNRLIAFSSALLFGVHPIHSESVSFICARVDLICLVFFLTALLLLYKYLLNKKILFYLLALFCFSLSLLTKEMAAVFILVIILLDYLVISKRNIKNLIGHFLSVYLGVFLVFAAYFILRNFFVGWAFFKEKIVYASNFISGQGHFWRVFTAIKVMTYYLRLLFFPYNLKADYIFQAANSLFEPAVWLGVMILTLLIFTAIKNRRENPILAFSLSWFFITFLPVSNIIPVGNIFAERFMYIPSVGFCMAMGFLFSRILEKNFKLHYFKWRPSIWLAFFLLIIFLGKVTFERNKVWKNDFILWYETVKAVPNSARAHLNLANVYYKANYLDKAIEENNIALKLHPEFYYVFNNAGNIYLKKGLIDEAIKAFHIALVRDPYNALVYNNLAVAYAKKGQYQKAIQAGLLSLKNNPYLTDAHYNLALNYVQLGFFQQAISEYEEYLAIHPDNFRAHLDVGRLYYKKGDFKKAKSHWRGAVKICKDCPQVQEVLKLWDNIK